MDQKDKQWTNKIGQENRPKAWTRKMDTQAGQAYGGNIHMNATNSAE